MAPNPAYPNETFERLRVVPSAASEPALEVETSGGATVFSVSSTGAATLASVTSAGALSATTVTASGAVTAGGVLTPSAGIAPVTAAPTAVWANGFIPTAATDGTDTTPTAGTVYVSEIFVPVNFTATGLAILNGSAVTDEVVVAVYSNDGTFITSSDTDETVTQENTATIQKVPFVAPEDLAGPDTYFVSVQFDGNTSRFRSQAVGVGATTSQAGTFPNVDDIDTVPADFTTNVGPVCALYFTPEAEE